MGQKDGEKWTAAVDLQPTILKSDRLLASPDAARAIFSALQLRAADAGMLLRAPPAEPTTCCGRGCNGCVWESYYAAAAWWQEEALHRLEA